MSSWNVVKGLFADMHQVCKVRKQMLRAYLYCVFFSRCVGLVTDAFSRKIVGFHVSNSLGADGTLLALQMAIGERKNLEGLIHHSDRGCQYCSERYVNLLKDCKISIGLTKAEIQGITIAERVNGILKMELLQQVKQQKLTLL